MTVDERVLNLLSGFGLDVEQGGYTGKADSYITFNYGVVPTGFADDEPEFERYLIQIHLFGPLDSNLNPTIKGIKAALDEADFGWPELIRDDDQNRRHAVIETDWIEAVTL